MKSFLERLKSRKIVQWALAYVAGAAVVLELLDAAGDPWNLPPALIRTAQALVVVGFLATLVLAWYHGERGRQRVTGMELLILAILLAVGGLVIAVLRAPDPESARASEMERGGTPGLESRAVVVGVPPAEVHVSTAGSEGWSELIQRVLSGELARPRGLSVMEAPPGGGPSEAAEEGGPYRIWRDGGASYVVRSTVTPATEGVEVAHHLADAGTGRILHTESFTVTDETELARRVRLTAMRLIDHLEGVTGGVTKAMDIEPWLAGDPDEAAVRQFLQGTEYAYRRIRGGGPYYDRALEIDPDFVAPRIWAVSGMVAGGEIEQAREHVEVLRELEPEATPFEQAMIGWADALVRWDLEAMEGHLEVALGYSPGNNTLLYNLGFVRSEMGRPEEALEPLRRAVETRWPYPDLYTLWGLTAVEAGRVADLRETLEGAIAFGPHSPTLYGLLEALALFDGDRAAARSYGETFRQRLASEDTARSPAIPGGAPEVVEASRSLAELARSRGETETAISLLRHALLLDPERPAVRAELARALAEGGERQAAAEEYDRALRGGDADPETVYLMGEVARLLDRNEEALRHFARYLELDPDGPHAPRAREQHRTLVGSR